MVVKLLSFLSWKDVITSTILFVIFFTAYALMSINRHSTFNSHAFDLGIYSQVTYLYSQGLPPYSTLKHMNLLADHFGVILFLLSPIYKVFPSSITLLIIQALFVSLSSIPVYFIAKDNTKSFILSILLTLTYLTSIGIVSAIGFDFHLATISVLPLSLVLYFWYFKYHKMYWLSVSFSVLFKEDIPLFIFGLGIYQLIIKQFRLGSVTVIFSIVSLYIIKFRIMPSLWVGGDSSYLTTSYLPINDPLVLFYLLITNPKIYLNTFFNSPIKIDTFHSLYREFAYLPIFSPLSWLTAFIHLFLRFSSNYTQSWTLNFHHNASIIPFLVVSSGITIANLRFPKKLVAILLFFFLLTGGMSPNSFIYTAFKIEDTERFSYINDSIRTIPHNAAISAQSPIVPHLSNREKVYLFPEINDAEYIVLDIKLSTYPIQPEILRQETDDLKKSKDWILIENNDSIYIFKKKSIKL